MVRGGGHTATDAKSRFSDLINRAASGERFVIRRRQRDVAVLISPAELERLERASQAARRLALALGQDQALLQKVEHREAHPAMAAFGLWRAEVDLADLSAEIAAGSCAGGWICRIAYSQTKNLL